MNNLLGQVESSFVARAWREWLAAILISAAAAFAIVVIFTVRGVPSGHDFEFHAASWLEVAQQWRQGVLFPRWAEWANWGFGEPRFIFYPPLSWMLGAALGLTLGWKLVAGAFVVVAQTLAGLSMFALARRTLARRGALFAAFAYAANPYALLVVYMRSDFAEQLAAAIFPLLFLTIGDLAETEDREPPLHRVARFALVFAAIWLCNAPAGVLASYSAALIFAWLAFPGRAGRRLLRGAAAIALGFGLCALYLLPAIYEQRWVRIAEALSGGLRPADNFLYTLINDPEHNLFNWIASTTAVGMIVLAGLAGVAARRRMNTPEQRQLWRTLMLLAAVAAALMLPFTKLLWRLLPELAFLQFPWRWMVVLAVPMAYFLGAASQGRRGWIWVAVFLAAGGCAGTVFVQQTWWDTEDIPTLQDAIAEGQGYEGVDEYDPLGDDRSELPQNAPRARLALEEGESPAGVRLHVERWGPEEKIVTVHARRPVKVALRLVCYPAWRVTVNGKETIPQKADTNGQMIVGLASGESRIAAEFVRTRDRWLGGIVSGLAALLAALFLRSKSK